MTTHDSSRGQRGGALLGALLGALAPAVHAQTTAPYEELTNVYRTVTNLNIETVRGMAHAVDGTYVFINTHGSILAFHRPGGVPLVPDDIHPTLNNPIALDLWYDLERDNTYVAVLGGVTHALALHDFATGRIVASVQLPAETGDVVVDNELRCAFVSCPGDNTVHQIDLALAVSGALPQSAIIATYTVASQRPRFLALDPGKEGEDDNVVYVTPELSGNNTVTSVTPGLIQALPTPFNLFPAFPFALLPIPNVVGLEAATTHLGQNARPIDLDNFASITSGLPDEDLFRIDPVSVGSTPQTLMAVPVLRGAGTVLAAHGRNPNTGRYWIVGTDAHNGDLLRQSEPLLKGDFARNQLSIATALGSGTGPVPSAGAPRDLDLPTGGLPYAAPFSLASPYALEFDPESRFAVIAGATADRVRFADNSGARLGDLELPDGSIPRDLLFDPTGEVLFVYCWGTNEVRIFGTAPLLAAFPGAPNNVIVNSGLVIDLGVDPTQGPVKRGRALFYDADNSASGRFTCNTCHPGAGTDILGWVIKNFPHDHKDVMVTQSLKGIEDTFPYHWRGERDLAQFNVAFEGLLGGQQLDPLPGGELDDFSAFIFSIQAHANPRQNPARVLDRARATSLSFFPHNSARASGANPDPIVGQDEMDEPATLFASFSCAECHQKVHGTVADINLDDPLSGAKQPTNGAMDVAHFRQLFHRNQDLVDVQVGSAQVKMIRGGYGISHDGNHPSVLDFIADSSNTFDLSNMRAVDLGAFIEQADQGVSPAVHRAYYLDANTLIPHIGELQTILFAQVGMPLEPSHGVSVAAIGTHRDNQGLDHDLRWYYFPPSGLFHASDPSVVFPDGVAGVQSVSSLVTEILAGRATLLLLGVPPGNAIRWSIDRDDDWLDDATELANGLDPLDADTDGDGDADGHEFNNRLPGTTPHTNPSQQANDNTPPGLVWWRLDHTTASTAKVVYFLSEPARVRFVATPSNASPIVVEERFVYSLYDTVVVQHLASSLPPLSVTPRSPAFPPTLPGIPTGYTLSMVLTDLAGNQNAVPIVLNPTQPITTKDQLVAQPFLGTPAPSGPAILSRIITGRNWNTTTNPGVQFSANVSVRVRYDSTALAAAFAANPSLLNGHATPVAGQVLVAQVNILDQGATAWRELPLANPAQPSTLGIVPDPLRVFTSVVTFDTPDSFAPFVISDESNGAGTAVIQFALNNPLPAGAQLELNFLGIYERDSAAVVQAGGLVPTGAFPRNVFWPFSLFSYQMPATQESLRALRFP